MNIYYIIGLLTFIFIGVFKFLKQKYITGSFIILITILSYGFLKTSIPDERIIVACSPDYKPFCFLKNGNVVGLDRTILEEVGKKLNKKIKIKIIGFSFLFNEIKQNKASIAMGGLSINEEKKLYLNFSIPYLSNKGACGVLTKKNIILNEDFDGVIGVQIGTSSFKEVIKNKFPKATIIEMEDFMMLLENFKNNINNITVIVSDTIVLIDFLENQNNFQAYKLYKTDAPNVIGTGFLLGEDVNINEFNKILNEVISNNKELKVLQEKINNIEDL
jgi:ABC-type amino acid transport substrate-binding protein